MAAFMGAGSSAQAENRVTVRGQYYREPSTRVAQPVVEIAKDLPGGIDVTAHYLLDAITSASAASGPSGDNIFTEYRSEAGLGAGLAWSRWQVRMGYKYSAESDYWSHTLFGSAALRTWGDSGTLALSFGGGFDQVGRRVQGNAPTPTPGAKCAPGGRITCPLNTLFGGLGYSQVLTPTLLAQAGYEFAYQEGYLSNAYRGEMLPDKRLRNALSVRGAKYFPSTGTGLQFHYRYYWDTYPGATPDWIGDPWQVRSHTFETRFFQLLGRDLEARLTGRYYSQGPMNIFCDAGDIRASCQNPIIMTNQPQLASIKTRFLEAKVYWDARTLRGWAFLGWFAEGTFELSYGHFFQSTSFKGAHVVQTAYSLSF
jgi:Protein of unknown function (DUF3570)